MERKLNFICDTLDEIPKEYYFSQHKLNDTESFRKILVLLNDYFQFTDIKKCTIDDVFLNPDQNYYYIIQNLQNNRFLNNCLYFGENLENLLRQNKNLKVVLLNESESDREEHFYILNNILRMKDIDGSQFFVINNNDLLKRYKQNCQSNINVHSIDFIPIHTVKKYKLSNPEFKENKKFTFTIHNKRLRSHRHLLLSMLQKDNILNECDWSSLENWRFKNDHVFGGVINYDFFQNIISKEDFENLKESVNKISETDVKKSTLENNECFCGLEKTESFNIVINNIIDVNPYKESYVNIVNETYFDLNEIHITEKSFIPFNFYQIPLIVATKHHVKRLIERYDFDMFTDLIDISYDNEDDHRIRIKLIYNEIYKLYQNRDKLVNFYVNNKDRFYKNREKMLSILNDKRGHEFFQSLI